MCNGITKTGKACSRKAEWCSQHLSQKPVAEPVIVDKKIEIKEENVVENIAALPTMPPNTSTEIAHIDETPIANASILEETKSVSVKNIFAECKAFLKQEATGKWYETNCMLKDTSDGKREYLYKPMRDMSLLRVEHEDNRRFYWIYNPNDAKVFNEYVGLRLRAECHEVFITPQCRFFFDIDLSLDEMEKNDLAEAMGHPLEDGCDEIAVMELATKKLASIYSRSIAISLEEHGALDDPNSFDWMATSRNRPIGDDGFKISIHLITNIVLPHAACAAIAKDIQDATINENAQLLGVPEALVDLIAGAVDPAQYRKHGSLGLPYGTKRGMTSFIIRDYSIPGQSHFLSKIDQFCISDVRTEMYNVKVASTYVGEADLDFVKQALACVGSIPDFDPATFDVSIARMKGSCLIAKRYAPSHCSVCQRTHDKDNTLQLYFNSEDGFATWKCRRKANESKCFFRIEQPSAAPSEDDIESFASKKAKSSVSTSDDEDDAVAAFATKKIKPTVKKVIDMDDMDDPFDCSEPDYSDEAKPTTAVEIAVEQELLDINLDEIKANPESYDSMLLDLCKIVPTNWFKLVPNIRSLARMIHQMAMSDPKVMRNTYLLTMAHHGGEWFDLKTVLAQYQRDGPSEPGKFLMGLGKLKQAAGGADKDAYSAWKSKYEPEPEEGSTSKASKRSSGDDEKKKPVQLMKEKMIRISDGTYRREFGTGRIYKKKTPYYYVRAFDDPKQFLNEIFATDEMYHMSSQKDHNELLHFIKDITHPDFPFVKIDYDYIGFANGVYCLKDATFIARSFVPSGIQVRVYHDIDYEILEETPLLDKYFGYQFENKETIEFIYFMFGRVLTTLQDKFDFMIMLVGVGGAGKSLLMNLHSHSFSGSQIGILSSTFQGTFGLSEFATKQIVISDDMPRNLAKTVPKSDFLSMQSRGRISCPVKGKTSIEVDSWDIGTIINSNDLPNYSDTSGEIVRRVAIIKFNNAVPDEEKDNDLESKIKATEYCTFLHRCRSTYLKYREKYRGKNIYTFCPQHFIDSRDELRGAINESFQFGKAHLEYAEGEKIAKSELTRMFRAYIKDKYNLTKSPKQAMDAESVAKSDDRYQFVRENICQSCRNKHSTGCCDKYSRTGRSKAEYLLNARYTVRSHIE